MLPGFATVTDLQSQAELLRARRFGVIEVANGCFQQIRLRPWPKAVSAWEVWWSNARRGAVPTKGVPAKGVMPDTVSHQRQDRCRLFYNQPWGHGNFLALRYVESWPGTRFGSFWLAVRLLDEIARIKESDALLCDVANVRISDRLLARWGWEPHLQQRWHRHFIKRFYGEYPPPLARLVQPAIDSVTLDSVVDVEPALCG